MASVWFFVCKVLKEIQKLFGEKMIPDWSEISPEEIQIILSVFLVFMTLVIRFVGNFDLEFLINSSVTVASTSRPTDKDFSWAMVDLEFLSTSGNLEP